MTSSPQGDPPAVTVLMPVRDAAGTIGRAVQSVFRQTLREWELVIVDDGSTDGTWERLVELAAADPRIRPLRRPARGIVDALNAGLGEARGRLVARMDADDEMLPTRLEEQVSYIDERPGLGLAGCLVRFGGDRSQAPGYAMHVDWLNSLVEPGEIALSRFVESPFAHPSVLFRRELVERHGGYRGGDFPEDYELWLRWMEAGVAMEKVPRELVVWHDPPGRLSRTDARYAAEAFFRMKAPYLARATAALLGGRKLLVWGAGRLTRRRAEWVERHGLRIDGYVDIDPAKIGRPTASGLPVMGPAGLPPPSGAFVLGYVSSRGARDLIRGELRSRGFCEGRDFLMAA
ncbi:putative glycosyltransferase EpsE [mine drainage metagenome]|uniref:Putative glycosyltransferase EpsE n=1 Tax=mine drainage metagenome TaxID=410659 RepID=A0A1J5TCX7_9ZZZZ